MSLSADLHGRRPAPPRPVHTARATSRRSARLGVAAVQPDWELVALNGDRLHTPTISRSEPNGSISAVTYRAELRPTVGEALRHLLDPNSALVARRRITGGLPVAEFEAGGVTEAAWSMDSAVAAAAAHLGLSVTERGGGALVEAVRDDTGGLRAGDVVVAVDGRAVDTASALRHALEDRRSARVDVRRATDSPTSRTETLTRHTDDTWGIRVVTAERSLSHPVVAGFTLPDDLGGPSLGLACALSVVDALTGGDLAGGGNVAATGTVDLGGRVGSVGAMVFKARAVRADASVRRFVIPAQHLGDVESARRVLAGHCEVLPVSTLSEAVSALRAGR